MAFFLQTKIITTLQSPAAAHISDIAALYSLLTEHILLKMAIPNGEDGYYFAVAHKTSTWDFMQRLAERLYALGLVAEPKPHTWPNDEMAAESLGVPLQIVRIMGTHRYTPSCTLWLTEN